MLFFKRCLFIQVGGIILKTFGSQESRIFSGFVFRRPVLCFISLVCCISLCGQIFSSGFFRKENILLIFSRVRLKWISLFLVWIRVCFTFLYTFRVLWGLVGLNNNTLSRENDSGNLFFSFFLVSLGLFAGYNMQTNSSTNVFFSLFSEKFLPIFILLSIFFIIVCFNFIHFITSGIFYLDFLVSSLNAIYSKSIKILDFLVLSFVRSRILDIKNSTIKSYIFFSSNNLALLFFLILMIYFLCCLSFLNISLKLRRIFNNNWFSIFFFIYLFFINFCFFRFFKFFWYWSLGFKFI